MKVEVVHVNKTIIKEMYEWETPSTLTKKNREPLLIKIEPIAVKYGRKTVLSVLHYGKEPFVRDYDNKFCTDDKKRQFLLENRLYVELDDKKLAEVLTDPELKDKVVYLENGNPIIFLEVNNLEYIRHEALMVEQSNIAVQTIKAMASTRDSDRASLILYISCLVFAGVAMFFSMGGINLVKFW